MEELLEYMKGPHGVDPLPLFFKILFFVAALSAAALFVYDRYVQRHNQLLINYPLIGRLRYFFYLIRDPMRQYFGDEKFYESFDKVKWVYDAAEGKKLFTSFSPGESVDTGTMGLKNALKVLNKEEVSDRFSVLFGKDLPHPFRSRSIVMRSAMSDGAVSPEATQAFSKGAYLGKFPINTGEGSLTTNFFYTHRCDPREHRWFEYHEGTWFAKGLYHLVGFLFNKRMAVNLYRGLILPEKEAETYLFDRAHMLCFRVDWRRPVEDFPEEVPEDLPDIVFQMGSGLYGVRDAGGAFDEERYRKVMRFCRMSEIKLAQGAKQTGGKLLACKVTEAIAWYRGVEPYKDLFSPDRFPYFDSIGGLFDFIGRLKRVSGKPVGVKIVISSRDDIIPIAEAIRQRIDARSPDYPDFLTIDGGEGGSGTAPLEMMMRVGLNIRDALYLADTALREKGVRGAVRLIASEKVLTPDDVVILRALGADMIAIARGFMMSAGCIRARECSGAGGRRCPVGLATQDRARRASFLVEQKARRVARYHESLLEGCRGLLAVMGKRSIDEVGRDDLFFKEAGGRVYENLDDYFDDNFIGTRR
ncbi:FMN-binding glutamate synthase family protein [Hydrogenimonas sp. SS33]|uniref:FMN-binding glutamate synthase family protein n=1 Tax=Hydrogenimonas leucolamina TaxID=2954236 RepID=UPI00336BB8C0